MASLPVSRARDRPGPGGPRSASAPVDHAPLLGRWVNFDPATTGIVHLEIALRDGRLAVRVWGAGSPTPHDWGEAVGEAFTDGVDLQAAVAFRATCELGFARVMLACYLNQRLLVVDAYSSFTDGSGRSAYFQRDHFYVA